MAKQLNVNLAFNADTGKAKAQIQELQGLLSSIQYTSMTRSPVSGIESDIQRASAAARDLQFHLNNAFNATTGKFDLSLFDKSLKASGQNVSNLSAQLLSAGQAGQTAFIKLAQSISAADQPMFRLSSTMREFGTVMKNTIKWQLSSSLIHGFIGSIQSAYGYAKSLNSSLNDIRIVTGHSADEMARFAENANKAAKQLSTTTTDYTKASLIYFQQGLGEKEVAERTEATIKMANVTGQSAQTVSNQLTAIWNNFDDGSKSLEYYVDVITALGAATATSTDEISQGLQKFAAVSETVGLSYEYATAALATIMSNTRESADVVGTALKTLFARIQGLRLGETLEDGTTLNKYSEALNAIGISIYENNGELKAMDKILDEMAAKWDTMGKAEQTALAQTVAGVRQYTQLIALMENWDNGDSDSFKANLRTVSNAEGTLQEQADIYAQSWEAAEKRVKASAEAIFQSLLNDKFFISLNNGFASALDGVNSFIKGLGGVKPLIQGITSMFLVNFAKKIPQALENIRYNLSLLRPSGMEAAYKNISTQMDDAALKAQKEYGLSDNSAAVISAKTTAQLTLARTQYAKASQTMSAADRQAAEMTLQLAEAQQQAAIAQAQKNAETKAALDLQIQSLNDRAYVEGYIDQTQYNAQDVVAQTGNFNVLSSMMSTQFSGYDTMMKEFAGTFHDQIISRLQEGANSAQTFGETMKASFNLMDGNVFSSFVNGFNQVENALMNTKAETPALFSSIKAEVVDFTSTLPEAVQNTKAVSDALRQIGQAENIKGLREAFASLKTELGQVQLNSKSLAQHFKQIGLNVDVSKIVTTMNQLAKGEISATQAATTLKQVLDSFPSSLKPTITYGQAFASLAGSFGSVAMAIRSVKSAFDTLSNPDTSGIEKLTSVLMAISMTTPAVQSSIRGLTSVWGYITGPVAAATTAVEANNGAVQRNIALNNADMTSSGAATSANAAQAGSEELVAGAIEHTNTELEGQLAIEGMEAATSEAVIAANAGQAASEELVEGATQHANAAVGEEVIAEGAAAGTSGTVVVSNGAQATSETVVEHATKKATAAIIAKRIAMLGLAVVAIAAVVAIVNYAKNLDNATKQAERNAAATREFASAAEEAKNNYKDLTKTFEEHDEVVKALGNMTNGAEGFASKLREANDLAWGIIEKFNLIKGQDFYFDENGIIQFTEQGQEMAEADARQQEQMAGILEVAGTLRQDQLDYNKAVDDSEIYQDKVFMTGLNNYFNDQGYASYQDLFEDLSHTGGYEINQTSSTEEQWKQVLDFYNSGNQEIIDRIAAIEKDMNVGVYELDWYGNIKRDENGNPILQKYNLLNSQYLDEVISLLSINYEDTVAMMRAIYGQDWKPDLIYAKQTSGTPGTMTLPIVTGNTLEGVLGYGLKGIKKLGDDDFQLEDPSILIGNIIRNFAGDSYRNAINPESIIQSETSREKYDAQYAIELAKAQRLTQPNLELAQQDLLEALNYTIDEKGNVFDSENNKVDELSNLNSQDWREIIAYYNTVNSLVQSGLTALADPKNQIQLTDEQRRVTAAINNNQTTDQIYTQAEMEEMNKAASGKSAQQFFESYFGFDETKLSQLAEASGLGVQEYLDQFWNSIINWEPPEISADRWQTTWKEINQIAKDLDYGSVIEKEDFDKLQVEGFGKYFQENINGDGYVLTVSGDILQDAIDQRQASTYNQVPDEINEEEDNTSNAAFDRIALEAWLEYNRPAASTQNEADKTEESSGGDSSSVVQPAPAGETYREGNKTFQAIPSQMNKINEYYKSILGLDASLDESVIQEEIAEAIERDLKGYAVQSTEKTQAFATMAETTEELEAMYELGKIAKADLETFYDQIFIKELGAFDLDLEEFNEYVDIVEEAIESGDEYYQSLKGNQKGIRECAKELMRFDRAVTSVEKNYDDWLELIDAGTLRKGTEEYKELSEAYGDIFDIDGSALSKDFITSAENLELLKQAAQGSEDAFNSLQAMAGQDLMGRLYGDANPEDLGMTLASLDEINSAIERIAAAENVNVGDKVTFDSTLGQDVWNVFENAYNAAIAGGADVASALQAANDAVAAVGFEIPESEYEVDTETVSYTTPDGFRAEENGSLTAGNPPVTYSGVKFIAEAGEEIQVEVPKLKKKGDGAATKTTEGKGTGSGKKGGGGGGGSKPKKAKEVKKSDVVERYKEITDKIDDLTESMNDASKAADRMYGNDRIKQMEKVNKLLKDEIGLIEQKKEEAQAYLQEDRQNLEKAASEAGVSFEFGENGNITNYTQEMTKLYNELNSAITAANADGNADEDEQENIDKIQEKIDKVKDMISQYDETKELIEDLDNDIQEKLYEIYDNELEAFEYKVELDLELSEDSMKIIEFQMGQIEDDAFKAAESIALTNQKAENLYDTLMTNKNAMEEAFGLSDIAWDLGIMQEGQEFTEAQIELMKEYRDNIMDTIEEMSELRETVEEQVMEVFDAWNDKLETNMDTLDHFGSMLDSYKNIVDIVGQDTMGLSEGFMQNMQNASVEHALDQMKATKEAYETMMSARMRAEQALEDARARGDDASAKMWEETLTELNSNMESAQEDMLSAWEDALSTIQDNFEATVERVVETFNNAVYAFGGMEGLSNEFSRQKEMADLMVDDYQKIYELSKLNRDIQKTLDDTDVIAGKQKLLKLQEKINALEEEGVELSQYDLEYLQAEYELRMAEIELANAQAKKDTVRLSKDNEGNWSYIYTTSTDAVDEAQQKYEDALYAMQELSSNYVDEMSEQLISTSQEMAEALAEVRASDFASQEDYEKELDRIRQMYQERLDQQEAELQKSINNNKDLYTQDWTNYHEATGYKISDTDNFVTSFKDSMLGTLMQSESDTANFNNIMSSAVDILTTGLVDAATTYYLHMEQAMQAAGTSTNDFATDMQENIDTVVQKSEEGAAAIEEMAEKMTSAFWDITDSVTQWQEGYGAAMQQVIDSNLAVVESFNNMLKELSIDPDSIKVEYDISTDYGLEDASSMDTGGYTGTWGTAGKLAILHEKELVLNPDDTSNFLQAIGISKTLLETIDLNARQASNGMGLLSAVGLKDSNNGTLEQNVHIEATFPNVTDHNEIEEAMKNLVNTASQYANRK